MAPTVGRSAETGALEALVDDLCRELEGEVRFSDGDRALYSTDASNYRQLPIGVVVPAHLDDVVAAVAVCRLHHTPLLARGAGTSLAGQSCNAAVVLDLSKHCNRIEHIDPEGRTATVQPGVVLDDLRRAARPHGLTFGPDPATHDHCTLGGMLGNNSCGTHSVMAGRTAENVEALEVLTYDGARFWVGPTTPGELDRLAAAGDERGRIYAGLRALVEAHASAIRTGMPHIPRRVSGYGLDELLPENGFDVARALVGTEGTCAIVLRARLRLVPDPPHRLTVLVGYEDGPTAADAVPEVLEAHDPIGLEGFDRVLVDDVKAMGLHPEGVAALPPGGGWLLVELGGDDPGDVQQRAERLAASPPGGGTGRVLDDDHRAHEVWGIRESGLGAAARVPGQADTWPGWEDAAVDPARLGDYLRRFRELLDRYGYHAALYGHFGQGCVHTRIDFDLTSAPGVARFRAFLEEAARLVVAHGGSLSGEHGDGQARAELLPVMYPPELMEAFRTFKSVWDPTWRLNPGKVVRPAPVDVDLRLGSHHRPRRVDQHLHFTSDGSFARATARCVGVGECRRTEGATMCPSYRVTRDEEHSTRGRARLLFEMMNGAELDGWRDRSVREALDLCLACKGCLGDCPVHVDMASYKAEFLAHHYAGRLRPRSAYALGLIMFGARLGSAAPATFNAAAHNRLVGGALKRAAGVAPSRHVPALARTPFRSWFAARPRAAPPPDAPRRGPVVLWPDTFTDRFWPRRGRAAVRVLEAAGFDVSLPQAWLCCGRPLYDFGFLRLARRMLTRVLDRLGPEIDAGVPVVGLEPSCTAVFRHELAQQLPHDARARRLADQTLTFAELLQRHDVDLPPVGGRAIVQRHCHQEAVMGFDADRAVLGRAGVDADIPDSGCCGMAGAFGFEAAHVEVSRSVGELVLLPAVRAAPASTTIVADGFSCAEQVRQETGRRPRHLAEVLAAGLDVAGAGPGPGGTTPRQSGGSADRTAVATSRG